MGPPTRISTIPPTETIIVNTWWRFHGDFCLSPFPIRSRPVDPPPPAEKRHPAEPLRRRRARVVVQRRGALVESARMRRFRKSEPFAIQMVAKLVAERRKKRPKRGHTFLNRRTHPDA